MPVCFECLSCYCQYDTDDYTCPDCGGEEYCEIYELKCINCGSEIEGSIDEPCPECGGVFVFVSDDE